MNRLIFLDIDGVLNGENYYNRIIDEGVDLSDILNNFDKNAIKILYRIVETTKAKIVISSTWRFQENIKEILVDVGFNLDDIVGSTPRLRTSRGYEIQKWLMDNKDKLDNDLTYVIFDDDSDMLDEQLCNFIKTSRWTGLTDFNADSAIRILLKNEK